ncbi:MAG TPA: helix-turn-helix domain-containing protein [Candidatus Eisenbergiella intestinipullorum]|nr:helix-turn-helix domain-containing protein [Candidatus Eisenbergiella intestinipullorum]
MPVDSKALGRRIRAARKKASMTQGRLAEAVGISEVHISNMESGSGNPSLATLVDIANVLSVSADELLCDSVICCKPVFQKKILEVTADCDDYEIRILSHVLEETKTALRENGKLRRMPEKGK